MFHSGFFYHTPQLMYILKVEQVIFLESHALIVSVKALKEQQPPSPILPGWLKCARLDTEFSL